MSLISDISNSLRETKTLESVSSSVPNPLIDKYYQKNIYIYLSERKMQSFWYVPEVSPLISSFKELLYFFW